MEIRKAVVEFYSFCGKKIWTGIEQVTIAMGRTAISLGIAPEGLCGQALSFCFMIVAIATWMAAISVIGIASLYIFLLPVILAYELVSSFFRVVGPSLNQSLVEPLRSTGLTDAIAIEIGILLGISIISILGACLRRRHLMKQRNDKRFIGVIFDDLLFDNFAQYNLATFLYCIVSGLCRGLIIGGVFIGFVHANAFPGSQWYWWFLSPVGGFIMLVAARIQSEATIGKMRLRQNANKFFLSNTTSRFDRHEQ